jgi:NAD(P)-dependent dehydrogenase (short-subunit alcohol dehydrogenase family)
MEKTNKVAIVTGARRGIGKSIAYVLAREGYDVVVSDIDLVDCTAVATEISKKYGIKALGIRCDISKKADVKRLFSSVAKKFGRLDALVNNAGIFPFVSFVSMEERDWDKVMDINLKGTFYCIKESLSLLGEGGRIINISSIAASVGFEGLVHYCASKGAMNSMTRALALELSPKKITVNAIAPGAIATPGAKADKKVVEGIIKMIPLSRMGEGEDIAEAVAYLASEKASYITGQVLTVDGGYTLR